MKILRDRLGLRSANNSGFTLIEVVVAILLLAIVALGLIPGLVGALKVSSQNTNIATASQLVNQQIDAARAGTPTCATLTIYKNQILPPVVDRRGVSFQPKRSVTCTAGAAGAATVSVSVTLSGSPKMLATATTYVYVTS